MNKYGDLIVSLDISKEKFLLNRFNNLMVEVINSNPNIEIQNIITKFANDYLFGELITWDEIKSLYSTEIF